MSCSKRVAVALLLLSACTNSVPPSAHSALESLRKVQAATQVGVNYEHYNALVIEAKSQINSASRALPDGSLKSELNSAIDTYADGVTVWQMQVNREPLEVSREPGKSLLTKYSVQVDSTGRAG